MKNVFSLLIALLLIFIISTTCFAANASTTYSATHLGFGIYEHTIRWTADDSTGAVNSVNIPELQGAVFLGLTIPSSVTAPTDQYDITLTDKYGVDVFGGVLANRSATANKQVTPKIGSAYGTRYSKSRLTFALSNNSVNSAQGTFVFYSIVINR